MRMVTKVLTLIGGRRHREVVHGLCRTHSPTDLVIDVSSATDAVMTLLAEPVDLVLVDAALAGDLLEALTRHARRSAPNARLVIFGGEAPPGASDRMCDGMLPWTLLESTVHDFLHAR